MKRIVKDIQHYLSLMAVLVVGVIAFGYFSYDSTFQMIVSIATAISYVIWGIIHHHLHRDLYLSVVVEYVVFASLGLVIIFSLIFGS